MIGAAGRTRPTAYGIAVAASSYGMAIPTIYGRTRVPLLLIWNGNIRKGSSDKKSKKKGIQTYVENADFLIGSNPAVGALQGWNNNNRKYLLDDTVYNFVIPGSTPTNDLTFQIPAAPAPPDPHFYAVIGVTATVTSITGTFNDYGGQGSVPYGGSGNPTEIPLWNLSYHGPDLLNPNGVAAWPFVYNWTPAMGPNIYLPDVVSLFALFDQINVYYVRLDAAFDYIVPLSKLRLTFENVLGNGPEYTGAFSSQQILYPEYFGVGSDKLDLGASALIPNIGLEVLASNPVNATGDADFVDMIADIIKSGSLQVGTALGLIQRGLNCNDFPGPVQKNFVGYNALSITTTPFYQPNAAGSALIVAAHYQSGGGGAPTITDTQGNTYIPVFTADQFGLWYCASAIGGAGNKVTVTPFGGGSRNASGVYVMELDPDSTVATIGTVVSGSGGTSATASITVTGNAPILLLAFLIIDTAASQGPPPVHWTPLFTQSNTFCYRIVYTPGTYSLTIPFSGASSWKMVILAFSPPQPVSYPKPFGRILDETVLALARNQCRANGLWGSLNMDSQKKASEWLGDIGDCANVAYVWSGFKLKCIPRSEVSAFGNGTVYTSPTASGPVANLSDLTGDFLGDGTNPPITITRKGRVNAPDLMQIQHPYRGSDYNDVITAQPETGSLSLYGPRKASPRVLKMIQDVGVARMVLGILVRRQNYIRNTYKFKLSARWKLLEAMDLVTITESQMGITALPVRLTSIKENEKYELDCEAEPFIYGMSAPLPLATGTPNPNVPATDAPPALVNPPIIFEAVPRLSQQNNQAELFIAVSDSDPTYGGCQVMISTDGGNSYNQLGEDSTVLGSAITGYVAADWPAHIDPDTVNDLALNLSESLGILASYQVQDEDSFTYPCFVSQNAQPSVVQHANNASAAATSIAQAFAANVTAGNQILVAIGVGTNNNPTIGVSDSQGNTYTLVTSSPVSGLSRTYLYMATAGSTGACTVTVTQSVNQNIDIAIHECTGIAAVDVFASTHATGPVTTVSAGPITPSQPNDLLFAVGHSENTGATQVLTNLVGYNLLETVAPSSSIRAMTTWAAPSFGQAPTTDTMTATNGSSLNLILVAFKGTGGTPAGIPYELMTYAVANLVSANNYTLKATGGGTNHLRRAVFGTPGTTGGIDHPAGCRFAFLGAPEQANPPGLLRVPIDPKWIGVTLYFKFLGFNQFLSGLQDPSTVVAYAYTPTGIPGATQNPNANYVQTPAIALSQPIATSISMAQVSTQFPSNKVNYNARTFTIPDPGGTPTLYYVTIADPTNVGDQGAATNLVATCQTSSALVGVPGNTYIGFIIATHAAGASATPAPGGWPPPQSALITP